MMKSSTADGIIVLVAVIAALVAVNVNLVVGPPVHPNSVDAEGKPGQNNTDWNLGLHYEKYLQEVIKVLEEDADFKGKLEQAKIEDISSGRISEELQFVNHRVRTRLDELKRMEIDRLRRTLKEQIKLSKDPAAAAASGQFRDRQQRRIENLPHHIDISNPHTFEIEDLKKLVMQTSKDLGEIDQKRRDEFKNYEMEKEHRRRESLQKMDEEHRKIAEKQHAEEVNKHKEHPKLHHPGSKQQLEEVWEEADEMPVEEFEPKTFHKIHDINGDGFWDYDELSALFLKELDKMYDPNNKEDDVHEREEEMNRMREHVMNETDVNGDGMISEKEFMDMTRRRDFAEDPGWEGLDEQQVFDEHEFEEYEKHRPPHGGPIPPGGYIPQAGVPHPGQDYPHVPPHQQQQMPNHGYPIDQQQFHPQQGYQGQPPQGYQGQQQGYQGQPPQGYQGQPPQGYQGQPPQGYQGQPPQGYQGQPPQGYQGQQQQQGYQGQQQVYQGQPQQGFQQQAGQDHPQVYQQGQPGQYQGQRSGQPTKEYHQQQQQQQFGQDHPQVYQQGQRSGQPMQDYKEQQQHPQAYQQQAQGFQQPPPPIVAEQKPAPISEQQQVVPAPDPEKTKVAAGLVPPSSSAAGLEAKQEAVKPPVAAAAATASTQSRQTG